MLPAMSLGPPSGLNGISCCLALSRKSCDFSSERWTSNGGHLAILAPLAAFAVARGDSVWMRRTGPSAQLHARRGQEGVPIYNQLREMWRKKLKLSAILSVLMAIIWLWQGYQGWSNLSHFNATQPWYRRLPGSTAIESWLLGTHTIVNVHGHQVAITKSTLQRDFGMDAVLVGQGQLHRLLTACFLHNSVFHILFNLGYLYTLAPLEVGCRGAFLSTFVISGIVGNLAFLQFGEARYAVGASGALCGLIGFELVSLLRSRKVREFKVLLRSTFGMLIMGLFLPGCATSCHVGGLFSGFLVALLVARRSGYRSALLPWPFLMMLLVLMPYGRRVVSSLVQALIIGIQSPGALGHGFPMR
eukprot:symbB.v1.2.021270.t1/scaffold1829.1/size99555/2